MTQEPHPKLSVLVIVYDMTTQALNTIHSLSTRHQQNVDERDYEIIVVENRSDNTLDPEKVETIGNNIHYTCREEKGVSPAPAINAGLALCRSPFIGLLIDGARMVTPRVIEYALLAREIDTNCLLAVPGYNLGPDLHHIPSGYNAEVEQKLLKQINWQQDGYRLFDIANISEANPRGVFQPFMECNCMFSSTDNFERIGGADESFRHAGGGGLNLHMYRSLGVLKQTRYFMITPGEGSFHQYHGGVSTSEREDREDMFIPPRDHLESFWGGKFKGLEREPVLLGAVTSHAQSFLQYSSQRALKRFNRKSGKSEAFWPSDLHHERFTESFS
jgi:hypothetical protein